MKTKGIWRIAAVTGILALSVTAADAGRGSGGTFTSVFKCYSISGANSPRTVTITGDDLNAAPQTVDIGSAVLVCSQPLATKAGSDPNFDATNADGHLVCYTIPGNTGPSPKPDIRITTPFNGGYDPITGAPFGEDVTVSAPKFICMFGDVNPAP